jgi:hypothetical protein
MSNMPPKSVNGSDVPQTPFEAIVPLLPYLPAPSRILEPCCGGGLLAGYLRGQGHTVFERDIQFGFDFLAHEFPCWDAIDAIVTNPPFSLKDKFLERCYLLGKPFALLLPITALEGAFRQSLYRKHGVEVIVFDGRINYLMPGREWDGCWFASAWFTHGLNIGRDLTFARLL